jgi:PHD/YefM family antitoxin component YafN of YafNO toxin-antitoxin module
MKLSPQFVVDEHGHRSAVLLPVEEYHQLLEALEDRLDAADLEDAVGEAPGFEPYDEVRQRLRAEGKI